MTQSSWLSLLDVVFKQAFKTDRGSVEYDLCPRGSFGTYYARDIKECGMKREGGKEWKRVEKSVRRKARHLLSATAITTT